MIRRIAVFTGNRAEYGLQLPIIRAINERRDMETILLVSGAHLDENFGATLAEIEGDGLEISGEIKISMNMNSKVGTAHAIGSGIIEISNALQRLKPDLLVVYADRFEGFAAVIAGTQMNIPTAHIEGGDITEGGALDDSVRHAMTKLAHLHFTTNIQATNRILAMGEESWRVNTVGFPAIDLISKGDYASQTQIVDQLDLDLSKPVVLFTQHSVTTEFREAPKQVASSLEALEALAREGVQIIITYPNNDAGGEAIIAEILKFQERKIENIKVFKSLGRSIYHGVLALSRNSDLSIACVGNSSSGIKETPAFGCPTVNIGSRQEGRLRGGNVIDTAYDSTEIYNAIKNCLYNPEFRKISREFPNPYWVGGAGIKIAEILSKVSLDKNLLRKKMMNNGELVDGWYR